MGMGVNCRKQTKYGQDAGKCHWQRGANSMRRFEATQMVGQAGSKKTKQDEFL